MQIPSDVCNAIRIKSQRKGHTADDINNHFTTCLYASLTKNTQALTMTNMTEQITIHIAVNTDFEQLIEKWQQMSRKVEQCSNGVGSVLYRYNGEENQISWQFDNVNITQIKKEFEDLVCLSKLHFSSLHFRQSTKLINEIWKFGKQIMFDVMTHFDTDMNNSSSSKDYNNNNNNGNFDLIDLNMFTKFEPSIKDVEFISVLCNGIALVTNDYVTKCKSNGRLTLADGAATITLKDATIMFSNCLIVKWICIHTYKREKQNMVQEIAQLKFQISQIDQILDYLNILSRQLRLMRINP